MFKISLKAHYSTIVTVLVSAILAYGILLANNKFLSIDSIINYSQDLELPCHILVLGLLPIYISAILFGAALFGIYLDRAVRSLFGQS